MFDRQVFKNQFFDPIIYDRSFNFRAILRKSSNFGYLLEARICQRGYNRCVPRRKERENQLDEKGNVFNTFYNMHDRYLFPFSSIITLIDPNQIGGSRSDASTARFELPTFLRIWTCHNLSCAVLQNNLFLIRLSLKTPRVPCRGM